MSILKKIIRDDIVNPTLQIRGSITNGLARITRADEINNICSVIYIDKDGYKSNKDNIYVKIYTPGLITWFPSVDEIVTIEEQNGDPVITGPYEGSYNINSRSETILKEDIYSDSFSETAGGTIF